MSIYEIKARELLLQVKKLLSQTDWTLISTTNGVKLESKPFPSICAVDCFRSNGYVEQNPEFLYNEVWNENEKTLKEKDPDIVEWKVVEQGNNYRVHSQVNAMPWPLWSREACCAQVKIEEPGCYWILTFSVEHPKVPLKPDTYVRPIVHMSVYGFEREGLGTRVYKIGHIDPSGYIPASVVNLYASKLITPILDWKAKY